jgi:hypothetical protein
LSFAGFCPVLSYSKQRFSLTISSIAGRKNSDILSLPFEICERFKKEAEKIYTPPFFDGILVRRGWDLDQFLESNRGQGGARGSC